MSRGDSETKKLQTQLQSQLERLLDQLQDLENSKEELDEEEYTDMREDTIEQVRTCEDCYKYITFTDSC